jgi:DNA-directed RNA polymerase subunit RPC12/RpoP
VKPSTISKTSSSLQKIGDVESKCLYCGCTLEKRPVRKKKCTNCGNFILVRTRPSDRQKVLVTEQQVARIQRQWQHRMPEGLERDPEYRQMRAKLRVNRGTEP